MRLRNGERWPGWKQAKKTLQESKQYDPELNQVYGKLRAFGLLSPGCSDGCILSPCAERAGSGLSQSATTAQLLYACVSSDVPAH